MGVICVLPALPTANPQGKEAETLSGSTSSRRLATRWLVILAWVAGGISSQAGQVGRREGYGSAEAGSAALASSLPAGTLDKAPAYSGNPGATRGWGRFHGKGGKVDFA